MHCGKRLSPIEKRGKVLFSKTVTEKLFCESIAEMAAPAGPAPITTTSESILHFSKFIGSEYNRV